LELIFKLSFNCTSNSILWWSVKTCTSNRILWIYN